MTLGQFASLAGGTLVAGDQNASVMGLTTEVARAHAGMVFVALDAHQREIRQAWRVHACVLSDTPSRGPGGPLIRVRSTLAALQRAAATDFAATPCPVIAITGSIGKTSIKEMVAAVLAPQKKVHRTFQNMNGQIGVPVTLLTRPADADVLVLEMGMSFPGEMARLVRMAPPTVAVLGKLGPVHLAHFSNFRALVAEKRRLLQGLPAHRPKHAVVHADSLRLVGKVPSPVLTYGLDSGDVTASDIRVMPRRHEKGPGCRFCVHGLDADREVQLPYFGPAAVENALAALAVTKVLELDPCGAIRALACVELDAPMRQEWKSARHITWINDCYNAAPASVAAALALFDGAAGSGRRVFVFGDMLELGRGSMAHHRTLARLVNDRCDYLFTFGRRARVLAEAVSIPAESFHDINRLVGRLRGFVKPGDTILFKASRAMRLERAVKGLEEWLRTTH